MAARHRSRRSSCAPFAASPSWPPASRPESTPPTGWATTPAAQRNGDLLLDLVFSGTQYWAIWRELGGGAPRPTTFKAVSVPRQGSVGALTEKTLSATSTFNHLHAAASAGSGFWLVLAIGVSDSPTYNMPTLHRFDGTGTDLDPAGVDLRLLPNSQQTPAIVAGAGGYLVACDLERIGLPVERLDRVVGVLDVHPVIL